MDLSKKDLNPAHLARRVIRKLRRISMRPLFREHAQAIRQLKDMHRGGRCFVICNGPSLNDTDLAPLQDEITFGMNAIFLKYDTMGFRPTYYTAVDPNLVEDRASEINALTGSLRFIPQTLVHCIHPGPDLLYFNYDGFRVKPADFPLFSYDAGREICWGSTVTYVCLQLVYHMGFETVYIIGLDHSYQVPDDAKGLNLVSQTDDPNHFHPDYFGKGRRWSYPRVNLMEQAYVRARELFEADGRRLINATVGGKLEVLPRADYNEVVRGLHTGTARGE
jgi:6-hydroxymethylpterin diphosphokinase MptE-like protein